MNISNTVKYSFFTLAFYSIKLEIFDAMFVFMNTVCLCVLEGERIYAHKLSFQGQIVKCNCY